MIYAVNKESRGVFEVRPLGEWILVRPAQVGMEHELQRLPAIEFSHIFDGFLSMFLLPNQLSEEDFIEETY